MIRLLIAIMLLFAAPKVVYASDADSVSDSNATPHSTAGDAERGRIIFTRCQGCHATGTNSGSHAGPDLSNLFGREAGTLEGYDGYSAAMRSAGFTWSEERLNEWLSNPRGFLPGNIMAFAGMLRQQDRNDLIAYLRTLQD